MEAAARDRLVSHAVRSIVVLWAATVAACGGGGSAGDGASPPPQQQPAGASAVTPDKMLAFFPSTFYAAVTHDGFLLQLLVNDPVAHQGELPICATSGMVTAVPDNLPVAGKTVSNVYAACAQHVSLHDAAQGIDLELDMSLDGRVDYVVAALGGDYAGAGTSASGSYVSDYRGIVQRVVMDNKGSHLDTRTTITAKESRDFSNFDLRSGTGLTHWAATNGSMSTVVTGSAGGSNASGSTSFTYDADLFWTQALATSSRTGSYRITADSGSFANLAIRVEMLSPVVFSDPNQIQLDDISFMPHPNAGKERYTAGGSTLIAVYSATGVTLSLDVESDGCLDAEATLTRKQVEQLVNPSGVDVSGLVTRVAAQPCRPMP